VIFDPTSFFTGLFFVGVGGARFVGFRIGVFTDKPILTVSSSPILTFDGVTSSFIPMSLAISSAFRLPRPRFSMFISSSLSGKFISSLNLDFEGVFVFEKKLAMFDLFSALFNGTMKRGESSPTLPTSFLTG